MSWADPHAAPAGPRHTDEGLAPGPADQLAGLARLAAHIADAPRRKERPMVILVTGGAGFFAGTRGVSCSSTATRWWWSTTIPTARPRRWRSYSGWPDVRSSHTSSTCVIMTGSAVFSTAIPLTR